MDIREIHKAVFDFLYDYHLREKKLGKEFHFTMRKTNRYSRLDKGYWFHGNEGYAAFSLWSGFDYANKTPNICYQIFTNKASQLVLVARDSDGKSEFITSKLLPLFDNYSENGYSRYKINLDGDDFIETLKQFIKKYKSTIDDIVAENQDVFKNKNDREAISFIFKQDFNLNLNRTLKWRERNKERDLREEEVDERPFLSIQNLHVKSFGPIKNVNINLKGEKPHFIFLTGENGGGKSTLLRAIALAISNINEYVTFNDYAIEISLRRGKASRNRILNSNSPSKDGFLYREFAAYGPHRLVVRSKGSKHGKKSDPCYGIFNDDGVLLDIWDEFGWDVERSNSRMLNRRLTTIRETLHDLNDKLNYIYFPGEIENSKTLFEEVDDDGNCFEPVAFDQLASGIRNITAMFGDMMSRLFMQQVKVEDIAQLKGIVLIDEIDLHLHPKLQKLLIEQLAATFVNVQFIVSTHSPIPLLGAPDNSVIIKVNRTNKRGVELVRLKKLENEIKQLLPNTILSSDIFDFDFLEQLNEEQFQNLKLEDDYSKIAINEKTKEKLSNLDAEIFPDDLMVDDTE